jgi:hypothetical protein
VTTDEGARHRVEHLARKRVHALIAESSGPKRSFAIVLEWLRQCGWVISREKLVGGDAPQVILRAELWCAPNALERRSIT